MFVIIAGDGNRMDVQERKKTAIVHSYGQEFKTIRTEQPSSNSDALVLVPNT